MGGSGRDLAKRTRQPSSINECLLPVSHLCLFVFISDQFSSLPSVDSPLPVCRPQPPAPRSATASLKLLHPGLSHFRDN